MMKIYPITEKQAKLIKDMNEFCQEKFDFYGKNRKDASDYISRNINEFKFLTMDGWAVTNGYM